MLDTTRYIESPYVYNFDQGPDRVRSHDDARIGGVNCVALVHLAIFDVFGELPPEYLNCYELFNDRNDFDDVTDTGELSSGDVLFFGRKAPLGFTFVPQYLGGVPLSRHITNWEEFPVNHVGVATGENEGNDPLILHASRFMGRTGIWPLSQFSEVTRYAQIHGIKRLKSREERQLALMIQTRNY